MCSLTRGQRAAIRSRSPSTCSIIVLWGEGCCSHASLARSRSPWGLRPYSNLNGEKPVDAWGTSQIENIRNGRSWSQLIPSISITFLNMHFNVWLNLSTRPSVWGWYTDVRYCLMRFVFTHVPHYFAGHHSSGMPMRVNISTSSLAMPFEAMVRRGMASGYQVE